MNTINNKNSESNMSLSHAAAVTGIGLTLMTILSVLAMPAIQTLAGKGQRELVESIASQEPS